MISHAVLQSRRFEAAPASLNWGKSQLDCWACASRNHESGRVQKSAASIVVPKKRRPQLRILFLAERLKLRCAHISTVTPVVTPRRDQQSYLPPRHSIAHRAVATVAT